ncbi:MAG: beta-lactamase family protein [Gammaproteobacteria bacterium]|nr:beta-lactamase family protein [Gammaproteobacteria bacterium]
MHINLFFTALLLLSTLTANAASPLPVSSPEHEQIDPARLERMHALVSGYIADGKHAGAAAMVVRNGKIVDWQTWGKANIDTGDAVSRDTIFRIYSMSKIITSVAVLQLFEQNKLLLSQPVTDFIPELKELRVFTGGTAEAPELEDIKTPITIRMLLNHTAGFTYGFFEESPVHKLYKTADLWNAGSLDDFLRRAAALPLIAQPGETYHYGISNDILALVVQRTSGMSFEEYIAENITGPLKMKDTAFYVPAEKLHRLAAIHRHGEDGRLTVVVDDLLGAYAEKGHGVPSGGGGLFSTIGDYARFIQSLLNSGELDGVRILGRKTIELAMQNSLPEGAFAFSPAMGWGLMSGLHIDMPGSLEPVSEGTFTWSGAATTHFFADPSEKLIGMIFTQHFPYDEHQLFTRFRISVYQALQ